MGGAAPLLRYDIDVNTPARLKIPQLASAFVLLLAPLALAACGTTDIEPTQAQLSDAWESANVAPVDYKADIVAFMRSYLNDPTNVRNAAVSAPVRKRIPGDPGDRIVSCLRFNAKTSSGRYAGDKTGVVVYGSGKLDHFVDTPKLVKPVCEGVALEPFPALQHLTRR
jgi:hypothetical protein